MYYMYNKNKQNTQLCNIMHINILYILYGFLYKSYNIESPPISNSKIIYFEECFFFS